MRATRLLAATILALISIGAATAGAATPSVRVATDYACALAESGTVSCWGANTLGQLGNGTQTDSSTPVVVKDVANAVQIDVGIYGACALIADGTVKCWGSTLYGALGNDSPLTETGTATTIAGLSGVTKISVGEATICAILSSPAGELRCWGYGSAGQLGILAAPSYTKTPVTVDLGAPATDVGVGEFHACAVAAGALKCWGSNNYKEILNTVTTKYETPQAVPTLTSGVASASAGDGNTCAIMTSGAIKCWGANGAGQTGTGGFGNINTPQDSLITSGANSIGYGANHRCALLGDSARCWGADNRGQLGDGTTTNNPVPLTPAGMAFGVSSIDSGGETTCAIVNKLVKCWGDNVAGVLGNGSSNNHNVPVTVVNLAGATDVAVTNDHGCAVAAGSLQCWGYNSFGALGTGSTGPTETSPVAATTFGSGQTATGVAHNTTCTFDSGAVKCSGYGYYGQLGNNTSGGSVSSAVNATILTSGNGAGIIAGGYQSFCAIPVAGANAKKIYCWGYNQSSVLGQGPGQTFASLNFLDEPTVVTGVAADATSIAVGYTHVCAVVTAAVRCWGQNDGGDVTGTNTGGEYPDPVTPGLPSVSTLLTRAVAVSYGSTCAIVTSPAGGVKCFGQNNLGTLGNGSTTGSLTPVNVSGIAGASAIAGSTSAFCAVVSGAVKCWGRNNQGQLGNGTNIASTTPVTVSGITDAVSVTGAYDTFCALLASGAVKCWGEGYEGQLGTGGSLFATTPGDVAGLTLFNPDPAPPYVRQKIKPTFKLNGKVKKSGKKIKVRLRLYYAAPAGSNAATVCTGTTTISIKTSKKKTSKFKVKFERKGANCSYSGTIKLPRSFKGKKKKFKISMPGNADVFSYKSTRTLKLK